MVTRATAFVSLLVSLTAWLYVVHRVSHRGVLYRLVQPSKRDRDCDSDQTECTCPPCMYIYIRYSLRAFSPACPVSAYPFVSSRGNASLFVLPRLFHAIYTYCATQEVIYLIVVFCLVNKCLIFSVGYISVMRAT